MRSALVIIDMQQGFFTAEAAPRHDAKGLVQRLNALAQRMRSGGAIVIFVQHDGADGHPLHPAMPGWKLSPDLRVDPADLIVRKSIGCDAFLKTELESQLAAHEVDRLIITGQATEYCVDTTVRSALARGYSTVVPADGHTTADRPHLPATKIIEHHNAVWADFIAPGGSAHVCPCSEVPLS